MCWNEPSTLRLLRLARESVHVAARLTKIPTTATASTMPPSTSGGAISRRTASNTIRSASTSSVTPLAWAERISTRLRP